LIVKNAKVLLGSELVELEARIEDGVFKELGRGLGGDVEYDAKGLILIPGLVDLHAHLRDWGLSYKETFESGTSSAVAGGFTTVFDMPNTSPPLTSPSRVRERIESARGRIYCDVGFYATPKEPGDVKGLLDAGCSAFKVFMHKPLEGEDYGDVERIRELMAEAERYNALVAFHAEDPKLISGGEDTVESHAKAHKVEAEVSGVLKVLEGMGGARAHICHLSTARALSLVEEAKGRGKRVSFEITPHHALLDDSTKARVEPPLRSRLDRERLFSALVSGSADAIATDHAPHSLEEYLGGKASGFPSLEIALSLFLNEVNRGRIGLGTLIELMSRRPARLMNLKKVGEVREGFVASFSLIDLKREFRIDPSSFFSKAKYSPFEGRVVRGKVMATFIRGELVYEDGEVVSKPIGRVIG